MHRDISKMLLPWVCLKLLFCIGVWTAEERQGRQAREREADMQQRSKLESNPGHSSKGTALTHALLHKLRCPATISFVPLSNPNTALYTKFWNAVCEYSIWAEWSCCFQSSFLSHSRFSICCLTLFSAHVERNLAPVHGLPYLMVPYS